MHLHAHLTAGGGVTFYSMRLLWEQIYPYVLAIISVALWWRVGLSLPTSNAFLGASITVGSIITGFLATAMAIVMALDSPIMQRLRETSYIKDLTNFLGQGIWLSLGFSLWTLLGFFIEHQNMAYGLVWIGSGVAASTAFIRITAIMLKIIKHPD